NSSRTLPQTTLLPPVQAGILPTKPLPPVPGGFTSGTPLPPKLPTHVHTHESSSDSAVVEDKKIALAQTDDKPAVNEITADENLAEDKTADSLQIPELTKKKSQPESAEKQLPQPTKQPVQAEVAKKTQTQKQSAAQPPAQSAGVKSSEPAKKSQHDSLIKVVDLPPLQNQHDDTSPSGITKLASNQKTGKKGEVVRSLAPVSPTDTNAGLGSGTASGGSVLTPQEQIVIQPRDYSQGSKKPADSKLTDTKPAGDKQAVSLRESDTAQDSASLMNDQIASRLKAALQETETESSEPDIFAIAGENDSPKPKSSPAPQTPQSRTSPSSVSKPQVPQSAVSKSAVSKSPEQKSSEQKAALAKPRTPESQTPKSPVQKVPQTASGQAAQQKQVQGKKPTQVLKKGKPINDEQYDQLINNFVSTTIPVQVIDENDPAIRLAMKEMEEKQKEKEKEKAKQLAAQQAKSGTVPGIQLKSASDREIQEEEINTGPTAAPRSFLPEWYAQVPFWFWMVFSLAFISSVVFAAILIIGRI
ncbi:MAG: hypothetical protein ACRC2T_12915, partial [Thermoguttaceae bacterium]